jgi:hypothetical protein
MNKSLKTFLIAGTLLVANVLPAFAGPDSIQSLSQQVYAFPQDGGAGGWSVAGVTVGTASVQVLAPGIATRVYIQNTSASAAVACSWGGIAVLNSSGSFQLAAGQTREYGPMSSGVPSITLNCIASAVGTPLYIEKH